jgi:hypothetical protein
MRKGKEMNFKEYKSKCCNAKLRVCGLQSGDILHDDYTMYYVCAKCGKPCDIKKVKIAKKLYREV